MDEMNITSAQYQTSGVSGENCIRATVDGKTILVPLAPANTHYAEILRQVAAGDLTIADAD
jgi:hypothetical protein